MSLTVVVGRPNSGKTGILWDVVRRSAAQGFSPVVVLPSRPDAEFAAREFAQDGPTLSVSATVLDDYIDDLWRIHGDGRRIVGRLERSLALTRAPGACKLKETQLSAQGPGFAGLMEPLAAAGLAQIVPLPARLRVAHEIIEILLAYRDLLSEARMVERADAVQLLEELGQPGKLAGPLIANRFSDLTPLQESFLINAATRMDVWIALPRQEALAATRALDPLVERLIGSGAAVVNEEPRDYAQSDELRYVESHLFTRPPEIADTPRCGDVRLAYAYGEEAEAHGIAREIQDALADGVALEQIAVVFEDAGTHARALRSAFAEAGIVADFDFVRPAQETGWGRALAQLSAFVIGGERPDLLGLLRTPYSGLSQDEAERLEARWRRCGIERPDRLLASLRDVNPQVSGLVELAQTLAATERVADTDVRTWKFLGDALFRNAYGSACPVLDTEGLADASVHRGFLRAMSTAAQSVGSLVSGREVVEAFLRSGIAVSTMPRPDAVRVMSASRARSQRFEVVIVGGLSAGDFPRLTSEDPLSSPDVIAGLQQAGVDPDRRNEQDAARLRFYLVTSRATKRLVLSRQVATSDGSELRASWLLEELLDLYRRPEDEEEQVEMLPPKTVLGFDEQALSGAAPVSRRRTLRAAALTCDAKSDVETGGALALSIGRASPRQAALLDERVLLELSGRQVFSVTEIEGYLRCPYSWFHSYVVRAQALEPDREAMERGRLCHDALREVYSSLPSALGERRVTTQNLPAVLELAGPVVDRVLEETGDRSLLSTISTSAVVRRKVFGFLRADTSFLPGFEPAALEFAFESEEGAFEGFGLRGRIDRVDRGPNGELLVTDYKTGTVSSTHAVAKFASRGLLQLPLYARIAQAAFGAPVVGGLYRGVTGQNVRSKQNRGFYSEQLGGSSGLVGTDMKTNDEMAEVVSEAERRATDATDAMRQGLIPAEPLEDTSCKTCSVAGICPRVRG